jgi:Protein of unknown function (DUF2778)
VRGGGLHASYRSGGVAGGLIAPGRHLLFAGVAALAMGIVLGLQAARPSGSASSSVQAKNVGSGSLFGESQIPDNRRLRMASLDGGAGFQLASDGTERQVDLASAEDRPAAGGATFNERFTGAVDWTARPRTAGDAAGYITLASRDPGARASVRLPLARTAPGPTPAPAAPSASASKKPVRVADLSDDVGSPPDADGHTAIYDIVARKVYMPDGRRLEAHSGYGSYLDDPRYVSEKDRGPTPPNVYELSLREELFHGVRAIRLNPVGDGNMYGRDGMLAHTYMLGPNGQSNGCVSFSDYPAFLDAVLSGEVTRLVVVEHLGTEPPTMTASGWISQTIRTILGRS